MNYKNLFVGVDIGGTKISIVFFKRNPALCNVGDALFITLEDY